jgi:hypothetical protein
MAKGCFMVYVVLICVCERRKEIKLKERRIKEK